MQGREAGEKRYEITVEDARGYAAGIAVVEIRRREVYIRVTMMRLGLLKAFLLRGTMPHIVTEQPGSAAFFVID
jgi:hypothetical protein